MASALGRPLTKAHEPEAAMGSALLSAGWAWYHGSVSAAQVNMVQKGEVFEPISGLIEPLQEKLEELKKECHRRKYL